MLWRTRYSIELLWMHAMTARGNHSLTRTGDRRARDPLGTDWTLLVGVLVCHIARCTVSKLAQTYRMAFTTSRISHFH